MRIQRLIALFTIALLTTTTAVAQCEKANRVVRADVVAFDQLIMLNRLGASIPEGMIFALKRDVVAADTTKAIGAGNAMLRPGKRPRPIVLRVNQYDCLEITFTNWLSPTQVVPTQTLTRNASVHVNGMQLFQISDDGSFVGQNSTSLVAPGGFTKYRLYATEQGTFLLYSMGAAFGGSGGTNDGAQQGEGLFGAVNVEPPDAEWYRSQVTRVDLENASSPGKGGGKLMDYDAKRADGTPVLLMYTTNDGDKTRDIVYTDLTAVITGPKHGRFNATLNPCNNPNGPDCPDKGTNPNFELNYAEPDRTQPYREFTIIYHELFEVTQALPEFYSYTGSAPNLNNTLNSVQDQFAINYGTGGIGAEILANRFGIGPMGGCPDCKYEEFFLDSWTVGDPSMIVDKTANYPCTPQLLYDLSQGKSPCPVDKGKLNDSKIMVPVRKATKAFFPDDPSNVYHSYLNDHVKFRILHGGTGFSHVHHQHAHQWLRSPNNNESTYLDSQLINPGSAYTLEIAFGGSGNRNHTPGDSIFHCHFYPHFAGGMWAMWRSHDTFEPGTMLDPDSGIPLLPPYYARALPDAEILAGTPTPAVVPLPTIPMAPMPADVQLVQVVNPDIPPNPANPTDNVIGTTVKVKPSDLAALKNPGYPFFIPGISGVRAPHPPMDFAVEGGKELNGGLPRHLLLSGTVDYEEHNRYDFSKDLGNINAFQLPEKGTTVEKVAMAFHEKCHHSTFTPEGKAGHFATNGLPRVSGAPYADPALLPFDPNNPPKILKDRCKPVAEKDRKQYRAAVFQTDLVFNKQGWHYPQARMLSLWEDVMPTLNGVRPPEPLFFRVESDDATDYWHTNLVPDYYQLDDFQVRTPTDIIGQHIHLVKFDVTASDGASNGWNYEDGTFSPDEVRARIDSINNCGGLLALSLPAGKPQPCGSSGRSGTLAALPPPKMICGSTPETACKPDWTGAQTTVQRWMADPLKSPAEDPKIDRTLRTVFTHDHFGPSTHQQTGLYAAFIVEPPNTQWLENETGVKLYTRKDGGPTSWQAVVMPTKPHPSTDANTFREFAIALQDFQLTYANTSIKQPNPLKLSDHLNCNPPAAVQCGWADPANVLNSTNGNSGALPTFSNMNQQAVSAGPTQGTYTFNYRNEPLPYRLQKPASGNPPSPQSTDPSYVFASDVERVNPTANPQPKGGTAIDCLPPLLCPVVPSAPFKFPLNPLTLDMQTGDPYTPMLRTYEKDNVQIRVIVGAHMLPHPFTIQGVKWLFEAGDALVVAGKAATTAKAEARSPAADILVASKAHGSPLHDNSGFRSTQAMGISEHFEFLFHVPPSQPQKIGFTDFLYMPDSANPPFLPIGNNGGGRGIVDGMWGIMRAYQSLQPKSKPLVPLPTNKPPEVVPGSMPSETMGWWAKNCNDSNTKTFTVYAQNAIINFNSRVPTQPFQLATALVYSTNPNVGTATEPLILHANAGDCLQVTLQNNFNTSVQPFTVPTATQTALTAGYPGLSAFNIPGNANNPLPIYAINASPRAGLNPALLSYDVATGSGTNIGWNATEATVPVGGSRTYYWYAGQISANGAGTPIEFGAVNLTPSDPIQQDTYGLVGGLIVEPPNTVFCADSAASNAMGTVYQGTNCDQKGAALFREFVLVTQDNIAGLVQVGSNNKNVQVALNYRSDSMYTRFENNQNLNTFDLSPAFSNTLTTCTGGTSSTPTVPCNEPQTPIFTVTAGMPTRLHMLHPGGASDQQVFTLHGHIWQDEPFTDGSTKIGWNPLSPWIGSRDLYGTNSAYTLVLPSAGGANKVPGDYLYRTHPANFLTQGLWGIMRVTPAPAGSGTGGGGK